MARLWLTFALIAILAERSEAVCATALECFCNAQGGTWYNTHCYKMLGSDANWDAAFDDCSGYSGIPAGSRGRLAHLDSSALLAFFLQPPANCWLGIRATEPHSSSATLSSFAWFDGTGAADARASSCVTATTTSSYSDGSIYWDPESDDCLKVKTDGKFDGKSCGDSYRPFCEFLPEATVTYGDATACSPSCAALTSAASASPTTVRLGTLAAAVSGASATVVCDSGTLVGGGTHTYTCGGSGPSWSPTVNAACEPSKLSWKQQCGRCGWRGFG